MANELLAFLNHLAQESKVASKKQKEAKKQSNPHQAEDDYELEEIRLNLAGWKDLRLVLIQTDQKCKLCKSITPLINKHILVERHHTKYGIHQVALSKYQSLALANDLSTLPIVTVVQEDHIDTCLECYLTGNFQHSLRPQPKIEVLNAQEAVKSQGQNYSLYRQEVESEDSTPDSRPTDGEVSIFETFQTSGILAFSLVNQQDQGEPSPINPRLLPIIRG